MHFTVGVFLEEGQYLDKALAPYQENNMETCPGEFLEFCEVEEEHKKEYEEESIEVVKTPEGKLLHRWDERFRKEGELGYGTNTHEVPEDCGIVQVKLKDKYKTFEEYMREYCGFDKRDEIHNKYGYWANPNSKWDWYVVGGRWNGLLLVEEDADAINGELGVFEYKREEKDPAPNGYKWADAAKLKDIEWELIREISKENAKKRWEKAKNLEAPEKHFIYGIKENDSFESFLKRNTEFSTYAVITPDGKWYEKKFDMENYEENEREWQNEYFEKFIKNADKDLIFVIVDCHI